MADVSGFSPGQFSWIDLATTDTAGAKKFYSSLFGWSAHDMSMGPGMGFYTMLQLRGRDVGGLAELRPELRQQGVPSHWNVYVSVKSVDEAAKKAESLGAKVVAPPFDVMDVGRMAVIIDPTGAALSLWEPKKHPGAGVTNEAGAFCWFELLTHDVEKARAFYTALFGWTFQVSPEYSEIVHEGKHQGGVMKIDPAWGNVPPHWMTYFQVDDLDASFAKAQSLGAKVFVPPTEIANVGRFATLDDPQGAGFALYHSSRH